MDSLVSTFHIDWHLIIAQLVNFAVVFFVLWYFALKPLKKLMDERGKTIEGGLENAKKQEELLAASKADYEAAIQKANADAAAKMKEAKRDLEAYRAAEMEKAQASVAETIAAGKKQLEAEKAKMVDEAKKEIVSIVMSATERVLGQVAEGKIDQKLVEESIKNI